VLITVESSVDVTTRDYDFELACYGTALPPGSLAVEFAAGIKLAAGRSFVFNVTHGSVKQPLYTGYAISFPVGNGRLVVKHAEIIGDSAFPLSVWILPDGLDNDGDSGNGLTTLSALHVKNYTDFVISKQIGGTITSAITLSAPSVTFNAAIRTMSQAGLGGTVTLDASAGKVTGNARVTTETLYVSAKTGIAMDGGGTAVYHDVLFVSLTNESVGDIKFRNDSGTGGRALTVTQANNKSASGVVEVTQTGLLTITGDVGPVFSGGYLK